MKSHFQMSSMGELNFFLGLQVKQDDNGITIHQSKYVDELLKKFDMESSKPVSTPAAVRPPIGPDEDGKDVDQHMYRSIIGSLMYLTASRPDIQFAVCQCARYQSRPKESHLIAAKRILRYLKGKVRLGLWYPRTNDFDFVAYSDADHAGCLMDRKSTSGGVQFLGQRLVTWQCKKQHTVSQSTAEAEYVAASSCCSQVRWIQHQLHDYGLRLSKTPIYVDNEAAIAIVKNPVYHSKTKHIEVKVHFIRDCFDKGWITVEGVRSDDNLADLFTKPFETARFELLVQKLGMILVT
jgi:hypothetical protein